MSPRSKFSRHIPERGSPADISSKRRPFDEAFGVTTAASLAGISTSGFRSSGASGFAAFGSGFFLSGGASTKYAVSSWRTMGKPALLTIARKTRPSFS